LRVKKAIGRKRGPKKSQFVTRARFISRDFTLKILKNAKKKKKNKWKGRSAGKKYAPASEEPTASE